MYCIGHLIDVAGVLPRHLAKVLVDLKRLHEANLSWCTQYILACKEKTFYFTTYYVQHRGTRAFYLCRFSRCTFHYISNTTYYHYQQESDSRPTTKTATTTTLRLLLLRFLILLLIQQATTTVTTPTTTAWLASNRCNVVCPHGLAPLPPSRHRSISAMRFAG